MLAGLKVRAGAPPPAAPVPASVASCVVKDAPLTTSDPLMEPFCWGVNVTPTVQLAFAAKVSPHGAAPVGRKANAALAATPTLTALLELFVTFNVWDLLVTPTVTVPNARLEGDRDMVFTPTPVRLTNCGELLALSLIVMAPAMVPTAEGVKVTVIVQDAAGASDFGHLLACA